VKILARQVYRKAADGGKLPHNFEVEYSPGSFRSADITCVDKVLDLIHIVLSGVINRVLSGVGSIEEIFIQIHNDANSKGDIYVNMTIHKFHWERHIRNDHPVFLYTTSIDHSARFV